MKKHYIKAIVELLLRGSDVGAVLTNLTAALKRKGHTKLHAQILEGVLAELSLQNETRLSSVIVAKSADVDTLKEAIQNALEQIGGSAADAHVSVDQTLIGGFITSHDGKLIDRSYKGKLVSLYRSITK